MIIMTSNGEREFPPAFRRRCLSLKIKKPDRDKLRRIVERHFGEKLEPDDQFLGTAIHLDEQRVRGKGRNQQDRSGETRHDEPILPRIGSLDTRRAADLTSFAAPAQSS